MGNNYPDEFMKPSLDRHLSWRDSTIPPEGGIRRGNDMIKGFLCDSKLSAQPVVVDSYIMSLFTALFVNSA